MNKVDQGFDDAWQELPVPQALGKLEIAKRFFVAGARAFSTMPLCEHGGAVWGIESCAACESARQDEVSKLQREKEEALAVQDFDVAATLRDRIDRIKDVGAGAFPGYNRPFDLGPVGPEGPEGLSDPPGPQGLVEDLEAEHTALLSTLLNVLVKLGVLTDRGPAAAPWDAFTVLRFAGLWLTDAMPWVKQGQTHRQLSAGIGHLSQRLKQLEAKLVGHLCDHEEGKA
jgi:hypothetical protein